MPLRAAAAGLALVPLIAGCAGAQPPAADANPACALRHEGTWADSLKALPVPVRAALLKLSGAMADRGEFFNAGDVVSKPAPFNRFIRGGFAGGHWFAWYEHGGFAYWHQVVVFAADPRTAPLFNGRSTLADLCAETDGVLDGAAR